MKKNKSSKGSPAYEVWASDQSNSVPGEERLGVKGSFLWVFDTDGIQGQLSGKEKATPLPCTPTKTKGPCDAFEIFPPELNQVDAGGAPTGKQLKDISGFGRLHGVLVDPQNKYVSANFFTPGGGFIGIIDVETKEAISLFRVTGFSTKAERSVHMTLWSTDGSALLSANLHGKAIERINIGRDSDGKITSAEFDKSASIGLGIGNTIIEEASVFEGVNAYGRQLLGSVVGQYSDAGMGDLTPNGYCKQDGCTSSALPPTGRTNNVPICPIPSTENNLYTSLGGGGLLVMDLKTTPISIVGEYGGKIFNGAGCGGTQVDQQMFLNAGISAAASGSDQSTFTVYSMDDTAYSHGQNVADDPPPTIVYKDNTNTNTIGNVDGVDTPNNTGQIPGVTTRRDSHGIVSTLNKKFVHQFDRIQNVVEVFDTKTYERFSYDLTSKNGQSGRPNAPEEAGPCLANSVTDDANLVLNDPSPDLLERSPDGKFIFVGFRGPAPVSVGHSAQGSCPGVGVVEITEGGKRGKLVDVIRTTNEIDTAPLPPIVGGIQYSGTERSDIHSAIVVTRSK